MTETPQMPVLYVPDVYGNGYPGDEKSYNVSAATRNLVDYQLLKTVIANWDALGSGKMGDMPKPGEVMQVTPISMSEMRSETMVNYSQRSETLRKAFDTMQTAYVNVFNKVKDAKDDRATYQAKMGELIDLLNTAAATPPEAGTEDEYIMTYVAAGITKSAETMQGALDQQSGNATTIKDQAKQIEALTNDLKEQKSINDKLQKEIDALKKQGPGNPTGTGNPYDPTQAQPVGTGTETGTGTDDTWKPLDLGADGTIKDGASTDTGTGGSDGSGTGPGSVGSADPGSTSPTSPTSASPVSAASPDSGMGSGLGSGMSDMMNSIGPMMQQLAQQEMMRRMLEQNGQNGQVQQQPLAAQPAVAAQPQVQAQAQPAATTAPGAPAGSTPPPGASSSQPGQPAGTVPGHTPGADGMVDYTFPDGRTQKVTAVAAQGLDAAFGNQSGTDAQAAYAKTPAKWSDKKQIGDSKDPNEVMTGDVAVWKDRSAVVVKFGTPDSGGTLEAVIGGKLQELTSDNLNQLSDSAGEFGEFSGFVHPHGIEASAAGDQSGGVPGGAPTGDQSGAPMLAAAGGAPA
ncbi:hypothetical protein [Nocardia sp. NPDC050412]|uniref:hypothetical protein n=1 Tax=Nocardia sp. NPDC050412 TaxID=3364320 RepID=UPI0037AC595C